MTNFADVQELLDKAASLPDGRLKISLYEEAVRGADQFGSMDWRFYARHELVRACFSGGDPQRMLVALSWSLAKCDELGGCFGEQSLLWGCKFALSYICAFPEISRQQISELRESVILRFRKFGASLRTPYLYGMYNELVMGSPEPAAKYRRLWLDAPRDPFTESPVWELFFDAWYHFETDAIDRALELGLPMIDGRERADMDFWMTDLLLLELLKRGERNRAVNAHVRAYRKSADNPKYLGHMGTHLVFAALTGNFALARRLLGKHLPVALETCVPSARFLFMFSAWTAATHLAAAGEPAQLRLPKEFPLWREDGKYDWPALAAWFESQTRELEGQFNARNGNARYTRYLDDHAALAKFATDWPIG